MRSWLPHRSVPYWPRDGFAQRKISRSVTPARYEVPEMPASYYSAPRPGMPAAGVKPEEAE
eukprot:scaffold210955_cov15-Tisochrysis_lutea.AAC.1